MSKDSQTMADSESVTFTSGDQRAGIAAPTAGPWRVYDHDGEYHIVGPTTENGPWLVAITVSINETDEANARLIVRAVNSHDDLLAALDGMLERYTSLVNCGDCGFWDPEEEQPIINARAAIAKSEGR